MVKSRPKVEGMLRERELHGAVQNLVECALVGDGWEQALHRLARAADARGANLVCNSATRSIGGFASPDVAGTQARYFASARPPDSRFNRVRTGPHCNFRTDLDDFTAEELARDAYYQEFLRPEALFWHATTWLAGLEDIQIELSIKRSPDRGPFEPDEIAALDRLLPDLRGVARIARCLMDAETRGMVQMLGCRGGPVFELDSRGHVLRSSDAAGWAAELVRVSQRRLVALDPLSAAKLERAIDDAIHLGRTAIVVLGKAAYLLVLPVVGKARDIFNAAAAVAVLVEAKRAPLTNGGPCETVRLTFGLTEREARVATMLRDGHSPSDISRQLGIGLGTVRNHLKSVFQKTGVHKTSDLLGLLLRLHA
jgi:DNA-binding CsgD family transcriptional regulator